MLIRLIGKLPRVQLISNHECFRDVTKCRCPYVELNLVLLQFKSIDIVWANLDLFGNHEKGRYCFVLLLQTMFELLVWK